MSEQASKLNRRSGVRTVGGVAIVGAGAAGGVIAARMASNRDKEDPDKIGAYYEDKPVDPALNPC